MNLYMSLPYIHIAGLQKETVNAGNLSLYNYYLKMFEVTFDAYQQDKVAYCGDGLPAFHEHGTRESLINLVFAPAIDEWRRTQNMDLEILYDCFSTALVSGPASTYSIAKQQGLTTIIPVALSGQGGTEFAEALRLFQGDEHHTNAAFIPSQIVSLPDMRETQTGFPLGDGIASVIVSKERRPDFSAFRITHVEIMQTKKDNANQVIREMVVPWRNKVNWAVVHNNDVVGIQQVRDLLSGVFTHTHKQFPQVNFGCVDMFLTLHELMHVYRTKLSGSGLFFLQGRYGSAACIVMELLS